MMDNAIQQSVRLMLALLMGALLTGIISATDPGLYPEEMQWIVLLLMANLMMQTLNSPNRN